VITHDQRVSASASQTHVLLTCTDERRKKFSKSVEYMLQ
jgi:hypothetical protein